MSACGSESLSFCVAGLIGSRPLISPGLYFIQSETVVSMVTWQSLFLICVGMV